MIKAINGNDIDQIYSGHTFNVQPYHHQEKSSLLVLGPSGGGKEKRANYLVSKHGLEGKLGSGDIFRSMLTTISPDEIKTISNYAKNNKEIVYEISRDEKRTNQFYVNMGITIPQDMDSARAILQLLSGYFVDDTILFKKAREQINSFYQGKTDYRGVVLDGHIRTGVQVDEIVKILNEKELHLSGALLVHTPLELLEHRTVGRLTCPECKESYNTSCETQLPLGVYTDKETGLELGFCKRDKQLLKRRDDDFPVKVRNRLGEYVKNISQVLTQLEQNNVPVYVVSGNLIDFSEKNMQKSICRTLECNIEETLKYFI